MADLTRQAGGEVIEEIYIPLDADRGELARAIREIGHTQPDVIFSTVVGRATSVFYEAYRAAGFDASRMPIASLTTSEAEVAEMSPQAAAGHISAAPFFSLLPTRSAKTFVDAFRARFGQGAAVTAGAEAAYFQVRLVAAAIEQIDTDEPDLVRAALGTLEFDAPQGRVRVDASNNHTFLWPRVAKLDLQGRFCVVFDPGVRVKPDPYCVDQQLDDWSVPPEAGNLEVPTPAH